MAGKAEDGHQAGDRRVAGEGEDDRRLPRHRATSSRPRSATSASCRRNAAAVPAKYKGLPWARLGVDVEHDFEPLYVISADRKQQVSKLKALVKDADELYLATDEDREGEAIAWHLVETLKPQDPGAPDGLPRDHPERDRRRRRRPARHRRAARRRPAHPPDPRPALRLRGQPGAVEEGAAAAVGRPRAVGRHPHGRRARARADGVPHAPSTGTSRARSRRPRRSRTTPRRSPRRWSASTTPGWPPAATSTPPPAARPSNVLHLDEAGARGLAARLEGRDVRGAGRRGEAVPPPSVPAVHDLARCSRRPAASSAGRRSTVMRVAQRLYENGFITYMRTDSTNLSTTALTAARTQARELYGDAYVPAEPRIYTRKVKNAQEAHEAIRPAGDSFRTPGRGRQPARRPTSSGSTS